MLKLNLLPASYRQRGSVKGMAFLMLAIWLAVLAGLAFWAWGMKTTIEENKSKVDDPTQKIAEIQRLNALQQSYKSETDKISPETSFLLAANQEPVDIVNLMDTMARADRPGVIFYTYTLTAGSPAVKLLALAANYRVFTEWRLAVLQNPDFNGVPSISGPVGGPAIPYPRTRSLTRAIPVQIDVALNKFYNTPTFTPGVAGGDSTTVGGASGGMPGIPGAPGMGGPPDMGPAGYPGAAGAPGGDPAAGGKGNVAPP